MKKKVVAAMLVMCMALSFAACGGSDTKDTNTKTEAKQDAEDKTESGADADTDTDTDTTKTSVSVSRLVSVSDVSKYVTIGEYKGLTLDRASYTITDDDVQAEIDYSLGESGSEVKDGTVEEGDTVTINFTGTIDGKEFDGGSAEDYDLVIGEGGMIEGFEDGIVGMKKGETKELDLTFPDDYYDENVAGKAVVFKVTLQKFTRPAELNDEWVASNTDYKTVDEYRAAIKKELEDNETQSADYDLYSNAWSEVLANSEVKEYPKEDVEKAVEAYKKMNEDYVKEAGIEMSEFLESQGMSEDDYEDDCQQYAEAKVEQNLIVQGIMDAEGLSMDDDEIQTLKDELTSEYGYETFDELVADYGEQEVNESLALLRVEHFIVDNATVNETTGEDGEVANEDAVVDGEDTNPETLSDETDSEAVEESEDTASEEDVANEG